MNCTVFSMYLPSSSILLAQGRRRKFLQKELAKSSGQIQQFILCVFFVPVYSFNMPFFKLLATLTSKRPWFSTRPWSEVTYGQFLPSFSTIFRCHSSYMSLYNNS